MNIALRQRDSSWDVLKYFLILMVILGHWLEYSLGYSINRVTFNVIYLFHMPLFIFVSGYFSRKKDKKQFRKDTLHLIETYIVVQVLYVASSFYLQHKSIGLQQLYMPNSAAWYLMSLIFWRTILQMIPNGLESKWLLFYSVIISLLAGFIPVGNELSLQRTMAFLPFFFCGYLCKDQIKLGKTKVSNKALCCALLLVIIILSCLFLNRDISYITWCKWDYFTVSHNHSPLLLLFLRALYLTIAGIIIFSIIMLFPEVKAPNFFSREGVDTLFYYVYHIIIMRIGIIIIRHFHFPQTFQAMILYTLISLAFLFFLNKIKLFHLLLNPISKLSK